MVSANHALSNSASLPVHTPKEILSANRRRSQTKKTKAFSTGQSWRVLKSGYAAGGPEQGSLRCFADVTYRGLFLSATQASKLADKKGFSFTGCHFSMCLNLSHFVQTSP